MIAEGDEKLADFSDEKFPDSGDESDRIYQYQHPYSQILQICVQSPPWFALVLQGDVKAHAVPGQDRIGKYTLGIISEILQFPVIIAWAVVYQG